jgi:hypothetical protein
MTVSKSIYPKKGRARIYRHPDRYEFDVNGTGPAPDFVYKILRAPLDSDAAALGQLAVQSIVGYRKLTDEQWSEHQKVLNRLLPDDEEELVEQGKLPTVSVWPEEKATEVTARLDLKLVEKFMIPLNASANEIGAAILRAFAAIDSQIANSSRVPDKRKAESARGLSKARSVSKGK